MQHRKTALVCILSIGAIPYASVGADDAFERWPQRVEPVGELELEEYAAILTLDEDQQTLLESIHATYLDNWGTAFPDVERASNLMRVIDTDPSDYARLRSLNAQMDAAFFAQLEPILHDEQIERLDRVRATRQRYLFRNDANDLEGTDLDVLGLVIEVAGDDEQARAEIPQFLQAWEQPYIAALRDVHRGQIEWLHLTIKAKHEGDVSAVGEIDAARRDPERELLKLNETIYNQIREVLPSQSAAVFERRYLEASYPSIHPDTGAAYALYERVLAMPVLSNDVRDAVTGMRDAYERDHDAICSQMVKTERRLRLDRPEEDAYAFLVEQKARLAELEVQRTALNERQVTELKAVLSSEQVAAVFGDSGR